MNFNFANEKGGRIICGMAAYVAVKFVVNMILSHSFSIFSLIASAVLICAMVLPYKYLNYVIAGVMLLVVAIHLPDNLRHPISHMIYIGEAALDVLCAILFSANNDVKENYYKDYNLK